MKTSELTDAALDWAVEWAETGVCANPDDFVMRTADESPSTNWAQGGPIIERENIGVVCQYPESKSRCVYRYTPDEEELYYFGPTVLIAAMRCFVASKLGDDIEVPPELK